jgi:hypothetical protein
MTNADVMGDPRVRVVLGAVLTVADTFLTKS